MSDLESRIRQSIPRGELVHVIHSLRYQEREEAGALLAQLDSNGDIDFPSLIPAILTVEIPQQKHRVSELIAHVLSYSDRPVADAIAAFRHISPPGDQETFVGRIFTPLIAYLRRDPSRSAIAYALLKQEPIPNGVLIAAAFIAWSSSSLVAAQEEAIALSAAGLGMVNNHAAFAIGALDYTSDADGAFRSKALQTLTAMISESASDARLAAVVDACACLPESFTAGNRAWLKRSLTLADQTRPSLLHELASLLVGHFAQLTDPLLSQLVQALRGIPADRADTLSLVDLITSHLIDSARALLAIQLIESLATREQNPVPFDQFDGFGHDIVAKGLASELMTRWLHSGNRVLCTFVRELFSHYHDQITPSAAFGMTGQLSDDDMVTLARRALAYLFITTTEAAVYCISCAYAAKSVDAADAIIETMLDFLYRNFPRTMSRFLAQRERGRNKLLERRIARLVKPYEHWRKQIEGLPRHREMEPTTKQYEAAMRRKAALFERTSGEAMKDSLLSQITHRQIMLHGSRGAGMVRAGKAAVRQEIPMHTSTVSFEMPLVDACDPLGFQLKMRRYASEPSDAE